MCRLVQLIATAWVVMLGVFATVVSVELLLPSRIHFPFIAILAKKLSALSTPVALPCVRVTLDTRGLYSSLPPYGWATVVLYRVLQMQTVLRLVDAILVII